MQQGPLQTAGAIFGRLNRKPRAAKLICQKEANGILVIDDKDFLQVMRHFLLLLLVQLTSNLL